MVDFTRRGFLVTVAAAGSARIVPQLAKTPSRRILTLVYDKSLGMMRAIDRVVP